VVRLLDAGRISLTELRKVIEPSEQRRALVQHIVPEDY